MPIHYPTQAAEPAVFEGRCAPEDADALLEWLQRTPEPAADLAACEDLHMAVVQLLLACRVRLAAPPADRVLAACLGAPALPVSAPPAPVLSVPTPPPTSGKSRRRAGHTPSAAARKVTS